MLIDVDMMYVVVCCVNCGVCVCVDMLVCCVGAELAGVFCVCLVVGVGVSVGVISMGVGVIGLLYIVVVLLFVLTGCCVWWCMLWLCC